MAPNYPYFKKQTFILFFLLGWGLISASINKGKLDSLYTIFKKASNDTAKVNAHLKIIDYLLKNDTIAGNKEVKKLEYKLNSLTLNSFNFRSIEKIGRICYKAKEVAKARYYYNLGLFKSKQNNLNEWSAQFYYRLGDLTQREDFSKQSIPYFDSAIKVAKKTNENFLSKAYMERGRAYYDIGDYKTAIDDYIVSQKLFEKNNDLNDDYGRLLHFIGSVFKRQKLYEKALEYYEKELKLAIETKNKSLEAEALYLSAAMYGDLGDKEKELQLELKSLAIYKEENNTRSIALLLGNISSNYAAKKDYKKAIEFVKQSLEMYINEKDKEKIGTMYSILGDYYSETGQHKLALNCFKKAMEINDQIETKQLLNKKDMTRSIAYLYADMGNFKSAFYEYLDYKALEDSLNSLDSRQYMSDLEKKYDTEKKEKEITLLNKDKQVQQTELAKQQTQRNALIIGCVLVIIIAFISIIAFFNNKKKSRLLSLQVNEINYQNTIIKEKNKDITDSILYAKRLQEAVLPLAEDLTNYFPESFVLFKPKDIVSGDFYWFEKVNNKIIFIVGDSTGHGVPGAFMSILGHNLLNQIILEENITQPSEILSLLDKRVTNALNKKGSKQEYNDGMDIGICVVDNEKRKLYYSGANRPLVIKRGEEIFELKQNKFAIGGINASESKVFVQHEIDTIKNDSLYLFSDGYYDQFGGPKGKKFKFKQLQELLLSFAHKPMLEQIELLNVAFENWRGNLEQIDDVCVIGVRL